MAQRYPRRLRRHLQPRAGDPLDRAAARRPARRPGARWATAGSGRRRSSWCTTRCSRPATPPTAWPTASCPTRSAAAALRRDAAALHAARRGDSCLSDAQVRAVQTLHSPLRLDVELANGLREYPGRGPSGENLAVARPHRRLDGLVDRRRARRRCRRSRTTASPGSTAPARSSTSTRATRSARPAQLPTPSDHAARVREVSALMDSTNPDLSAFDARGGKLIMLENMADYAQSPYAGIGYYRVGGAAHGPRRRRPLHAPVHRAGRRPRRHRRARPTWTCSPRWSTGSSAARRRRGLQLVEQDAKPPFAVQARAAAVRLAAGAALPGGDAAQAASFACDR